MLNEPCRQRIEWHPVTRNHKGHNKADEKNRCFSSEFGSLQSYFLPERQHSRAPSGCFANPAREFFSPEQRLSYRIEISTPYEGDTPFTFSGAVWTKRMQAETAAGNAIDEDGITHRFRIKERKPL